MPPTYSPSYQLFSRLPIKCGCDPMQNRCDDKLVDYCLSNSECFTAVIKKYEKLTLTMGCLDGVEHSIMACKVGSKEYASILCCNSHDYCNNDLFPQFSNQSSTFHHPAHISYLEFSFYEKICTLTGFIIFVLICAFIFWLVYSKGKLRSFNIWVDKRTQTSNQSFPQCTNTGLEIVRNSTLKGLLERSCSSGSGSGVPLLVQRTISRSIELVEIIGRGKFSEVWKGVYQDEAVAVKIFCSHAEAAWKRECNIYKMVLLRHENVLTFVAADTLSRLNSNTQLWLITRYHEHGSLYDYLKKHSLTKEEMFEILASAAAGLVHLHTTIIGSQGKSGIAHRDIKSKNILVMSNKSCCIADLGLALVETKSEANCLNSMKWEHYSNPLIDPISYKVGTKRYMSPEVLDGSLNIGDFNAFKKSDVYSFALVMWETVKRCIIDGKCDDHELPYFCIVPSDPSYEEMLFIVCQKKSRPLPAKRWCNDWILMSLFRLMEECWSAFPDTRHSMLRLKKSITKLSQSVVMTKMIEI